MRTCWAVCTPIEYFCWLFFIGITQSYNRKMSYRLRFTTSNRNTRFEWLPTSKDRKKETSHTLWDSAKLTSVITPTRSINTFPSDISNCELADNRLSSLNNVQFNCTSCFFPQNQLFCAYMILLPTLTRVFLFARAMMESVKLSVSLFCWYSSCFTCL